MEMGLCILKFFLVELFGGIVMLKVLSVVYLVSFMLTGGINLNNV